MHRVIWTSRWLELVKESLHYRYIYIHVNHLYTCAGSGIWEWPCVVLISGSLDLFPAGGHKEHSWHSIPCLQRGHHEI